MAEIVLVYYDPLDNNPNFNHEMGLSKSAMYIPYVSGNPDGDIELHFTAKSELSWGTSLLVMPLVDIFSFSVHDKFHFTVGNVHNQYTEIPCSFLNQEMPYWQMIDEFLQGRLRDASGLSQEHIAEVIEKNFFWLRWKRDPNDPSAKSWNHSNRFDGLYDAKRMIRETLDLDTFPAHTLGQGSYLVPRRNYRQIMSGENASTFSRQLFIGL